MKILTTTVLFLAIAGAGYSQSFPGYRTGNYTGVNGVFFNPASIAESKYRWDLNLFSIHSYVGNDKASFRLSDFSESFDSESIEDQLFGKTAGASSGLVNVDIHGPSGMFNIGRNSFAITTRARVFSNITDIDGKLVDKLSSDFEDDPELPYQINSAENMVLAANAWSEYGISYGREILRHSAHYLKGGITLKYLSGAANAYLNIDRFAGTIDEDLAAQRVFLSNTTGRLGIGFAGAAISDFEIKDLTKMDSRGWGGDLGFIYEYRPGNRGEIGANGYQFRVGVAVTDIGKIRYQKDLARSASYELAITGGERFNLDELDNVDLDNYKEFLDSRPQYFTPAPENTESEYLVSLPTSMNIDLDYRLNNRFYLNLAGLLPLSSNSDKVYNNMSYTSVTFTPRFETSKFGVFLPVNYNSLTSFNAGISLRAGPFFIGSGSLITALAGESKQADVHIGVRFGSLKK